MNEHNELFRVYDTETGQFLLNPSSDVALYQGERYIVDKNTGIPDIDGNAVFERDTVSQVRTAVVHSKLEVEPFGEAFTVRDYVHGKVVFKNVIATTGSTGFDTPLVSGNMKVVSDEHDMSGGLI